MSRTRRTCFLVAAALTAFFPWPTHGAQDGPRIRPFIAGGTPADIQDFPYQVGLIFTRGQTTVQCGGSIIHNEWVLTAGHCFYADGQPQTDPSEIEIRYGDSRLDSSRMTVKRANTVVIHPQYQPGGRPENDIALVRIVGFEPERVIWLDEVSNPVGNAVVSGWGKTGYLGTTSNVLLKATIPLVATARCNDADHYNGVVKPGMLCAGSDQGGTRSCAGDSGGPLVQVRNGIRYQIGVASWGPANCDTSTQYSVFTRVSRYVDWINGVIRSHDQPTGDNADDCLQPRSNVPYYDCSMSDYDSRRR